MYEYNCRIVKVVDGDTIDVDIELGFDILLSNQRIRLKGVDTPESRTRDLEEKKFGLLAKEVVKSYCPDKLSPYERVKMNEENSDVSLESSWYTTVKPTRFVR